MILFKTTKPVKMFSDGAMYIIAIYSQNICKS